MSHIAMHILDDESDKKLNSVTIFLDKSEIQQILSYAKQLLADSSTSDHYHLSSEDYQKEITFCLYEPENIKNFHPKVQKLLLDEE